MMNTPELSAVELATVARFGLDKPEPCQCHNSHAFISPTHAGHCCFVPASQTCHPEEVAAWIAEGEK